MVGDRVVEDRAVGDRVVGDRVAELVAELGMVAELVAERGTFVVAGDMALDFERHRDRIFSLSL